MLLPHFVLGWGGGGGGGLPPKFFWPFWPQFGLKIRGAGGAPWFPRARSLDPPLCNNLVILNRGNGMGGQGVSIAIG